MWAYVFIIFTLFKKERGNLLVGSSPSSTRHIKEKENVQTCDHTCVFFLSFSRVGRSKTLRRFHWWRSSERSLRRSNAHRHQWVSFSWSCFQPCISTSTISWASSPREGNESRDRKIIRSSFFLSSYCSLARERWKEKRWSWSFPGFPSFSLRKMMASLWSPEGASLSREDQREGWTGG